MSGGRRCYGEVADEALAWVHLKPEAESVAGRREALRGEPGGVAPPSSCPQLAWCWPAVWAYSDARGCSWEGSTLPSLLPFQPSTCKYASVRLPFPISFIPM